LVRFCGLRHSCALDVKGETGHLALAAGVGVGRREVVGRMGRERSAGPACRRPFARGWL